MDAAHRDRFVERDVLRAYGRRRSPARKTHEKSEERRLAGSARGPDVSARPRLVEAAEPVEPRTYRAELSSDFPARLPIDEERVGLREKPEEIGELLVQHGWRPKIVELEEALDDPFAVERIFEGGIGSDGGQSLHRTKNRLLVETAPFRPLCTRKSVRRA